MSNPDLDPAVYDSQIAEREPTGVRHVGPGDAANFDVAMRPKRAPKPVIVDQIPADIEIDDARPVIVDSTQERAAREYNTLTINLPAKSEPIRVVGEDATRSRLILRSFDSDGTAVRIGPLTAYPDNGVPTYPVGSIETEVTEAVYAWNLSETSSTIFAWIERN